MTSTNAPQDEKNVVRSLERGAAIISYLVEQGESCALENIASAMGLKKTTAHRILNTLAVVGFVERDGESRRYKVGRRIVSLGLAAHSKFEVSKVAVPFLRSLRESLNETANLTVLEGTDVVIIERFPSAHLLNLALTIGSRMPAQQTATGKAILAFMPPDERDRLIGRIDFRKRTPHTLAATRELIDDLEVARERGFAVCDQEFEVGQIGFASPVFNHHGICVAGINVSFPLVRHPGVAEHRHFIDRVRQAAESISRDLGYSKSWPGDGRFPGLRTQTELESEKSNQPIRKARR